MDEDLFLEIISGEIPSEKIYEDDRTYAFLDIKPTNIGHTLVVPKIYSRNIHDIDEEDWVAVMKTARKIAPIIQKVVGATGVNIIMNNEPAAGQVIFHSHVHIVPRFEDDGFRHWKGTPYKEGEIEKMGATIRKELDIT